MPTLREKYKVKSPKLSALTQAIVLQNHQAIAESVLDIDRVRFEKAMRDLQPKGPNRGKKIILPDMGAVIQGSPALLKSHNNGEEIATTLKKRLEEKIRSILAEEGITTGAGKVPKRLSGKVEAGIREVYENYTKRNPKTGIPANIHGIAVTETRFVVNNIRMEYVRRLGDETSDHDIEKKWQHNPSLSDEPRPVHERLARKGWVNMGFMYNVNGHNAQGPHVPGLPPEETINCNCELIFRFVPKK